VAHSAGVSLSVQRALNTQCFAGKMQTIQAALHQRSVGKTRLACSSSSSSSSNALEMNNSHHVCVSTSPRRTPADRTICIQTYTRDARVADSTTFCRFLFTNAERWWLCYRTGGYSVRLLSRLVSTSHQIASFHAGLTLMTAYTGPVVVGNVDDNRVSSYRLRTSETQQLSYVPSVICVELLWGSRQPMTG